VRPWALTRISANLAAAQMAALLSSGIWHVHAPAPPEAGGGAASEAVAEEKDIAEIVQGAALREEPAARPQPVAEEGLLPRSADEAAIAQSMKTASKLGTPFCEECAKASEKKPREAA
jgi:hypothetical protein